jgi:hypothetical protein
VTCCPDAGRPGRWAGTSGAEARTNGHIGPVGRPVL